jgi:hypothetical protein
MHTCSYTLYTAFTILGRLLHNGGVHEDTCLVGGLTKPFLWSVPSIWHLANLSMEFVGVPYFGTHMCELVAHLFMHLVDHLLFWDGGYWFFHLCILEGALDEIL